MREPHHRGSSLTSGTLLKTSLHSRAWCSYKRLEAYVHWSEDGEHRILLQHLACPSVLRPFRASLTRLRTWIPLPPQTTRRGAPRGVSRRWKRSQIVHAHRHVTMTYNSLPSERQHHRLNASVRQHVFLHIRCFASHVRRHTCHSHQMLMSLPFKL
jgi:hypothetical protein